MMRDAERVFRTSLKRRAGYPSALVVLAVAALVKWALGGEVVFLKGCCYSATAAGLIFAYMSLIRLTVDAGGISLRWPMREEIAVEWDAVVQVRRAEAASPGHFFVDLIESPDKSLQFNPYFFDNPSEIIELLNRHLDSDLFKHDETPVEGVVQEIALAAENGTPHAGQRPSTFLVIMIIVVVMLLIYYKYF
ncbi:hypothetical protein ACFLQK_00345 [bacterium]